jgi:hypothetical protein
MTIKLNRAAGFNSPTPPIPIGYACQVTQNDTASFHFIRIIPAHMTFYF